MKDKKKKNSDETITEIDSKITNLLDNGEEVASINHSFSIPVMDSSFEFTREVQKEVYNYAKKELGLSLDKIVVMTFSDYDVITKDAHRIKSDSYTNLLIKKVDEKLIAILILSGNLYVEQEK